MERYSDIEVCTAAGIPASTLDYWSRAGILDPTLGDDFTADDLAVALIMAELARLGCPAAVMAEVRPHFTGSAWSWPEHLWITPAGTIQFEDYEPAAWVIHPRRILARSGPLLLLALAS